MMGHKGRSGEEARRQVDLSTGKAVIDLLRSVGWWSCADKPFNCGVGAGHNGQVSRDFSRSKRL